MPAALIFPWRATALCKTETASLAHDLAFFNLEMAATVLHTENTKCLFAFHLFQGDTKGDSVKTFDLRLVGNDEKNLAGASPLPPCPDGGSQRPELNCQRFWLCPIPAPVEPNPKDINPKGPAYACNTGFPVDANINPARQHRPTCSAPDGMRSRENSKAKYQPSASREVA
jgi:hypothetical protein